MKTVIAEKPSVAKEIADFLGAKTKKDGYYEGNNYYVTWAFGHFFEIKSFEELGYTGGWQIDKLPFIPEQYAVKLKDDGGVRKQFKVVKDLFENSSSIICATDAGREGELIFRYIYNYSKTSKPFERLWVSSLTNEALSKAFKNLVPGNKYDNLFYAAKARNEADYLVGLNSTIALTSKTDVGLLSLGRVQTPTLAIICSRFVENKEFVPQPFYTIKAELFKSITFFANSKEKWTNKEDGSKIFEQLHNEKTAKVESVVKKEVKETAPLLYDLTSLQQDANRKYGFSASDTLNIAQSLYEKKLLTYPRTGSCYIGEDIFSEIPNLLKTIFKTESYRSFEKDYPKNLNKKSVNASKVTDHHAILTTEVLPGDLEDSEKKIYNLVTLRVLQAFSENCIKDATNVLLLIKDREFSVTGSIIKSPGWRLFTEKVKEEETLLPVLEANELIPVKNLEFVEAFTKPKPLHTEASLLAAMETCGKEVEEEELKAALKENGIGTPATRASIIETLFKRNYIVREKKNILPTDLGLAVYKNVKDLLIAQVELTGIWENKLLKMENGAYADKVFNNEINQFTQELIQSIKNLEINFSRAAIGECPICKGKMIDGRKAVFCENNKENGCAFPVIFKVCAKKQLTAKNISQLIEKGETDTIKGFKNKDDKSFDAKLKIVDNTIIFDFTKENLGLCPKCKSFQVIEMPKGYSCQGYKENNCGFTVWKLIGGKSITAAQASQLITKGQTGLIKGFNGATKKFDAVLKLSDEFKTIFDFGKKQ